MSQCSLVSLACRCHIVGTGRLLQDVDLEILRVVLDCGEEAGLSCVRYLNVLVIHVEPLLALHSLHLHALGDIGCRYCN
jgi:hypothetical protein